jgi:PAS domain S-box-containing protein
MSVLAVASILIRLIALGWSIVVLRRIRDWRMTFPAAIFALMAGRQILAVKDGWVAGEVALLHHSEEVMSLTLSALAFLALFVVERLLDDQRKTFEALLAAEARYHTAFRVSPDAIVLTSLPEGTLLEVNEGFEKLFGHSRDEALGRTTLELELWADLEDRDRLFAALRKAESVRDLEVRFRTRSGEERLGLMSARKTRIDGATTLISIIRDVTAQRRAEAVRRRAEEERQAALRELEEKNAELERFTYTVSHDLKSPLITIRGFLGFLEKDAADGDAERLKRDLERIRAATGTMGRLLDELLELSRIGRLMNLPEKVRLTELGKEAVEMLDGSIAAAGVEVKIDPWLPTVEGDRQRLLEVYQNLIDNAVKFMGDQEEPRVEIGQRPDGDGVVLWVRDNGIGIDPRYKERVFQLFERLEPDRFEGTGIGLALVKRIVEVHGGRIWIESDGPGRGTTLCFTLGSVG